MRSQRHFKFATHRVEQISLTADSSLEVCTLKKWGFDAKGEADIYIMKAKYRLEGKGRP